MCPFSLSDKRLSPVAQASLHAISWPDFVPPAIRAGYIDLALVLHHQLIEKAPSDGQAAHPVSVIGVAGVCLQAKQHWPISAFRFRHFDPTDHLMCIDRSFSTHQSAH